MDLNSEMLLDSEFDEKHNVAIISPDDAMDEVDPDPEPRADEFDAMFKKFLPEWPEYETEAETIYTWDIEGWRDLPRRTHSPVFTCGGHPWRVLFFPFGNNVESASFYLEHGFEEKPSEDWYACVHFMLVLWNPNDPTMMITHQAHHRFTAEEGDWGFTRFADLRKLFAPAWDERSGRPMVEGEAAKLTAYVRVLKDPTGVLWHNFMNYDSKKETGMVGMKNQGATCYLNSLLQSLYFTNAFRQAVYQIPTEHEADKLNSAYALQRLFYNLQTSSTAVNTNELTASFGWDSKQIFEQQDVQELSRILMERMEEKMKGTDAENALNKMFVGKMKTYISCINVDYESSRIEDFWDIQLNVSGNKNLDDSFKDYIQVETMDGENKYFAEGYGLQDAKKGVIFESFPQVLHLQLKRFEYDFNRDAMMKVNDRYEFPEVWDASPYLSENADKSEPWIYQLHGVLVHSGDLNAGHYYAFLKPTKDGGFFKFDDDRVTRATNREALEDNFGGDYPNVANGGLQRNPYSRTLSIKRSMSAYMLVYIRESRYDNILIPEDDVTPPPHLAQRLAEERAVAEQRRKEREEAHLYMEVQAADEEHFKAFQGFDIVPWGKTDTETPAHPKWFRILRKTTVAAFTKLYAEERGLEEDLLRPWAMVNRQNGTTRPDSPVGYPDMTMEEVVAKYSAKINNLRIWMEKAVKRDTDGKAVFGADLVEANTRTNDRPLMLYLKCFDADAQTLLGVANIHAAWQDKVADLSPQILKLTGWAPGTTFKLSEEIKLNMIEPMKPKITLAASELQDGDIITVQKTLTEKEAAAITATGGYAETKDFYEYLLNRITVEFSPKSSAGEDDTSFKLTLSKRMTYDQFAAKVGEHLGVEPTHLRFTTVNANSGRPKAAVKRGPTVTLNNILSPSTYSYSTTQNQRTDALYYEILELSLSELETRKSIKISWLPEGISKEESYEVLVAKNGIVQDIIEGLQKKANLSDEIVNQLRIYESHSHKYYKTLPSDHSILSISEFFQLYAEKIPEEELKVEKPRLIPVLHFDKEPSKPHNIPFVFMINEGETFKDTKERLSQRTGIKGKQFEKIKFALVQRPVYSKPQYLTDDDVLWDLVGDRDDVTLGLDHVNKSRNNWGKVDSIFIK